MDWIVLLPPLVAIGLALWTRQVFLSLVAGLWVGTTILAGGNPVEGLAQVANVMVAVFAEPSNTKILLFSLLVGGLIALVQVSGGVAAFVHVVQKAGLAKTRRGVELLAWFTGLLIFVESSITSLVVGTLSRPFFDRLKLPREKLAYYCDATSAPVCMAIPLNGWGAFVLGLLLVQGYETTAVNTLVAALPYNFFSLLAIFFALLLALTGWGFGPMRRAERRAATTGELIRPGSSPMIADEVAGLEPIHPDRGRVYDFLAPIAVMIGMIFVSLYVTGDGNLMEGSGSTAVLWAVGIAVIVAMVIYMIPRKGEILLTPAKSTDYVIKGASGLVGVVALLVLAFALGKVSRDLEMGPYIVSILGEDIWTWWLPALVFAIGCIVSFTLGSSWTTFAILIPLALPLAEGLGISEPLMLGAILSGGVYGDHASPLSDTSIISSMASACDHVDHVNTQLPYSALIAGVSFCAFLVAGILA
ncbi:MAG: sodium:proton antiporter [Rhodothermaceae bacterium]|nr:sodium:proton antiporter [Bacteroidota bacterium]MXW14962.1 sodium:proton antiporter [Rhodothermaceae bacterium]MDE2644697.1 sodium:proton antiporter [Bacteroidota bacterium]MXX97505.1 sodium:proton antiporter [Rhodothermaceae bacterium]MXZ17071.1 sodium:proton antiporter [Rhodothermaceae bacterium]